MSLSIKVKFGILSKNPKSQGTVIIIKLLRRSDSNEGPDYIAILFFLDFKV